LRGRVYPGSLTTFFSLEIHGKRNKALKGLAVHESSRTTGLYDRRDDEVSLDEVERIPRRTALR